MDAVRLGRAVTAVRVRLRRTQSDVAHRAGVSRSTVARIEHGDAWSVTLGTLQKVVDALEIQVALIARWRGGEIDRLIDAGHAAMHEAMARRLGRLAGWLSVPEVSFAIYAERGVIDILAWHRATRSLLIIELKTILMNVSELIGVMDQRRRLGVPDRREPRLASRYGERMGGPRRDDDQPAAVRRAQHCAPGRVSRRRAGHPRLAQVATRCDLGALVSLIRPRGRPYVEPIEGAAPHGPSTARGMIV